MSIAIEVKTELRALEVEFDAALDESMETHTKDCQYHRSTWSNPFPCTCGKREKDGYERRLRHKVSTYRLWVKQYDKLVAERNFDINEYHGGRGVSWLHSGTKCCSRAIPRFCVCSWSSVCPDHGVKCHGTHD